MSPFLATEHDERVPRISPDGRWVAYLSGYTGDTRVYVQPFPDGGPVTEVSAGPGQEPAWAPDGRALYFRDGSRVLRVPVETGGATLTVDRPELLFDAPYVRDSLVVGNPAYDVGPDGRLLMIGREGGTGAGALQIGVVLDWVSEVEARVPHQ